MQRAAVADQLNLTEEERKQRLPSGAADRFYNRLAWAKTYLERAGLIEKIRRGCFRISPVGKEVLANPPKRIDINFLNQFPGFADFRKKAPPNESTPANVETETQDDATPEEALAEHCWASRNSEVCRTRTQTD